MKFSGEQEISAPRDRVWAALRDTDIVRQILPGAESVEQSGENEYHAIIKAKPTAGPGTHRFRGKAWLHDDQPGERVTIAFDVNGGAAGFSKGSLTISLSERDGDSTQLVWNADVKHGGAFAQQGQRIAEDTTYGFARSVFRNLALLTGGSANDVPEVVQEMRHGIPVKSPDKDAISPTGVPLIPNERAGQNLSIWIWVALLALVGIAVYWLFT